MYINKPDHCFNRQTKKSYKYKVGNVVVIAPNVNKVISEDDEWRLAFRYIAQKSKMKNVVAKTPILSDDEKAKRKTYQAEYRKRKKAEGQAEVDNIKRIRSEDEYKNLHGNDYEHQIYAIINNQTDDALIFENKKRLLNLINEKKFELLPAGIKRRVVLKIATPPWSDREKIKALYIERDRRNQFEVDDPWEVDHFYPILGKSVTGLHSHQNLVIIRKSENRIKSNKHPDHFYE